MFRLKIKQVGLINNTNRNLNIIYEKISAIINNVHTRHSIQYPHFEKIS